MENFEEIIAKMSVLRSHGFRFSVDDFGTGFSCLSYLKRLPIDELKIDRTFVHDIVADANSGAIAESIILLGRALGLSVIAEGVETAEPARRSGRPRLQRLSGMAVWPGIACEGISVLVPGGLIAARISWLSAPDIGRCPPE